MIKPLLLSIPLLSLSLYNCKTNQSLNNYSMKDSSKITAEQLSQSEPIVIRENNTEIVTYPVIIYTTNITALEKKNVRIQSKSKNFVTALITPEDIEKIYTTDGVTLIELPAINTTNTEF